ncbi:AAA family ATPase [Candidatus Dependentiae bacterium]|nr:AAA family ATPase [Candidatus Dependentiae bacterium]
MQQQTLFSKTHIPPLAEKIRPKTLDEVVGQEHLVGKNKLFRKSIENDTFSSCIFWGPPGSGKTTLANVIAHITKRPFVQFNAAFNGIKEIKQIIEQAKKRIENGANNTILFVDEIHRFNKAQQDAFLQPIERGIILLIGATTENPSFEITCALLSRCSVHVLKPLQDIHIEQIIQKVLNENLADKKNVFLQDNAQKLLVNYANGDARIALNVLEIAIKTTSPNKIGNIIINKQIIKEVMSSRRVAYDKKGEEYYNLISALHKSMRGSDPHASLYWLARMIQGGADPLYIARRLVRFASEDVGLADPSALTQAIAAKEAVNFLGFPEGDTALAQCVIYLATAPKSNKIYLAINKAKSDVNEKTNEPVPLRIRNAPTKLMKDIGYSKGYQYEHKLKNSFSGQSFLPESLKNQEYYSPGEYGFEKEIKKRMEFWKKLKLKMNKNT